MFTQLLKSCATNCHYIKIFHSQQILIINYGVKLIRFSFLTNIYRDKLQQKNQKKFRIEKTARDQAPTSHLLK
jgi:hypothetical protein